MRSKEQEHLFKISGSMKTDDPLVVFLYLLMRDHITPGKIAQVITQLPDEVSSNNPAECSNGWLMCYAIHLSNQLHRR